MVRRPAGFNRIPDAAGDAFEAARSTFRTGADSSGESVTSAKDALRDRSANAIDSAARFGRDYADPPSEYVSSEMFDTVRSNLTELFRARPLALGAIGLAIGAGIAAALPPGEAEAAYLGETKIGRASCRG